MLGVCSTGLSILPGLMSSRALRGRVEFGWSLPQGWEEEEEEAENGIINYGCVLLLCPGPYVLALPYWAETLINRAAIFLKAPWGSRLPGLSWLLGSPTFFTGLPLYPKTGGLTPHAPFSPVALSFALACLGNLGTTDDAHISSS